MILVNVAAQFFSKIKRSTFETFFLPKKSSGEKTKTKELQTEKRTFLLSTNNDKKVLKDVNKS